MIVISHTSARASLSNSMFLVGRHEFLFSNRRLLIYFYAPGHWTASSCCFSGLKAETRVQISLKKDLLTRTLPSYFSFSSVYRLDEDKRG